MYPVILVVHIAAMTLSLLLMPAAILLALRGSRVAMRLATAAIATTEAGFFAGVFLLFSAPLLGDCVMLTSYLVVMFAVYAFGFGWGEESKARLLKKA